MGTGIRQSKVLVRLAFTKFNELAGNNNCMGVVTDTIVNIMQFLQRERDIKRKGFGLQPTCLFGLQILINDFDDRCYEVEHYGGAGAQRRECMKIIQTKLGPKSL